jgi:hypothetical protein
MIFVSVKGVTQKSDIYHFPGRRPSSADGTEGGIFTPKTNPRNANASHC